MKKEVKNKSIQLRQWQLDIIEATKNEPLKGVFKLNKKTNQNALRGKTFNYE